MKQTFSSALGLVLVVLSYGCWNADSARAGSQYPNVTVDDATAARLEVLFRPAQVTRMVEFIDNPEFLADPTRDMGFHDLDGFFSGHMGYRELRFPGDSRRHVLLLWHIGTGGLYWVLLSADSNAPFTLSQDPGVFLAFNQGLVGVRDADLDADGVPEVMLQGGPAGSAEVLFVYRWSDGKLSLISPLDPDQGRPAFDDLPETWASALQTVRNSIRIEDVDGDGKAEIITLPQILREKRAGTNPGTDPIWTALTPTRVYRLSEGRYALWKEIPANERMPLAVPSIAVVHPGTLPSSELDAKGGGELRVFVSRPPEPYSVDDLVPASFSFDVNGAKLAFAKRWDNKKLPDLTKGNREWLGVPVKQEPRAKRGGVERQPGRPDLPEPRRGYGVPFPWPIPRASDRQSERAAVPQDASGRALRRGRGTRHRVRRAADLR